MARSWSELLGDEHGVDESPEERRRFLGRLRSSLGRTRTAIRLPLGRFDPRDDESWEALEEALIAADVGMVATEELVERLRKRRDVDDLEQALVEEITGLLGEPAALALRERPSVILVVGVNGTGKTTTIGKLAYRLSEHGRSVLVAAADTFRAAADEQLEIWSQRAGADFVGSSKGARSRRGRIRRYRGGDESRPRRRARRHGRPPAHAGEPDGGAAQDPARDLESARRCTARDAARPRRDDGAERPPAGTAVRRGRRGERGCADEARRLGQGRDRPARSRSSSACP